MRWARAPSWPPATTRAPPETVGRAIGIEEVHAEVLPGDKADVVGALQRQGRVAMVGDGVNDMRLRWRRGGELMKMLGRSPAGFPRLQGMLG